MKYLIALITTTALAVAFSGCASSASEEEKENFHRNVMQYDNEQEYNQFRDDIDEDYVPSVGNPPAWEKPVN